MKIKLSFLFTFLIFISLNTFAQLDTSLTPFSYGVSSGDPTSNKVIIWTRVTPAYNSVTSVKVTWRMATDTGFTNIVTSGTAYAKTDNDFTLKVNVTGLTSNTWYYYQFNAYSKYSLTGRTCTLPIGANVDSIRMAVVSCTNYQAGFFNVYQSIADRNDIDVILHLGDFIYEYGKYGFGYDSLVNRPHIPAREAVSLSDYRKRYAQYKSDPQSIKLMQQYPLIAIWDDHEVANDAYMDGAQNHDPLTEGDWYTRLYNAKRAYFDWMPIRKPDPTADSMRLYRNFFFGNLVRLDMLDTRLQGRTEQLATSDIHFNDTARTMMGAVQRNWLFKEMNVSTAKWNILGQQVMLAPLTALGSAVNIDQWDGYPAERNRLYASLQQNSAKNFVILTGDIHSAWANDLPLSGYSTSNRTASAGVEFVTPSVTSPNSLSSLSPSLIQLFNSHSRYVDLSYNGYIILDVNKTRVQSDYYSVSTIKSNSFTTTWKQSWYVNVNEKFLHQGSVITSRAANKIHILAPSKPMIFPRIGDFVKDEHSSIVSVSPNPAIEQVNVEFEIQNSKINYIHVYDLNGREVITKYLGILDLATYKIPLEISSLSSGVYILELQLGNQKLRSKILKQ